MSKDFSCERNKCSFNKDCKCSVLTAPAEDKDGNCKFFKTTEQLCNEYNRDNRRLKQKGFFNYE